MLQGNQGTHDPPKPNGHEKYSDKDKDKCPFYQIQKNVQEKEKNSEVQGPKKEKKMKGGCPFMPSENKKNPGMSLISPDHDIPYVSPLSFLLEFRGLFARSKIESERNNFDNYPIYLKHTLYHDDEHMKKTRTLEVSHRFFIYDKFKDQGNKSCNKGNYQEAVVYYERAISCFKWLEVKADEETPQDQLLDQLEKARETIDTEQKEKESAIEMEELKQIREEQKEMKKKYKSFLTTYNDKNVKLFNGEDLTESSDLDMSKKYNKHILISSIGKSLLLTIYLSLSVVYMNLKNFNLALRVLQDAFEISDKNSQIYFRRSQARSANLDSTLQDLVLAKKDIETAIEMKNYEKIFQSEPGILKILNLQNAAEIYIEQAHFVEKRIKDRKEFESDCLKHIFARAKEIELIEEEMIQEGKKVEEHDLSLEIEEDLMEFDLVREMLIKYIKIIEFYQENKNDDQVQLAKTEFQTVKRLYKEMEFYVVFNFEKEFAQNNEIMRNILKEISLDLASPKIIKRLIRLKVNRVKELFETGKFNMELFYHTTKEFFKKKRQQKEEEEKKVAEEAGTSEMASKKPGIFNQVFSFSFMLQLIAVFMVLGVIYFMNRNTGFFEGIFAKK